MKKKSRLDLYTKALLLIESEVEHAFFEKTTKEEICGIIYELAHSALTQHTNGCKHPEWDKKLNNMYEYGVEAQLFPSVKEFKKK